MLETTSHALPVVTWKGRAPRKMSAIATTAMTVASIELSPSCDQ